MNSSGPTRNTPMVYTHVRNRGRLAVRRPLDGIAPQDMGNPGRVARAVPWRMLPSAAAMCTNLVRSDLAAGTCGLPAFSGLPEQVAVGGLGHGDLKPSGPKDCQRLLAGRTVGIG
jgi:hypothetical protein